MTLPEPLARVRRSLREAVSPEERAALVFEESQLVRHLGGFEAILEPNAGTLGWTPRVVYRSADTLLAFQGAGSFRDVSAESFVGDPTPATSLTLRGLYHPDHLDRRYPHADMRSIREMARKSLEDDWGTEDWTDRLAACESLRQASDLSIAMTFLSSEAAARVLASPNLRAERLRLDASHLSAEAFAPLLTSPLRSTLRSLSIVARDDQDADPTFGDALLGYLGRYLHLEELALPRVPVSTGALVRFLEREGSRLRRLDLEEVVLGDAGLHALARSPALQTIDTLNLAMVAGYDADGDFASVGPGLKALLGSPYFRVRRLNLERCRGAASAVAAARPETLRELRVDAASHELERVLALSQLEALSVSPDYDDPFESGAFARASLGCLEQLRIGASGGWDASLLVDCDLPRLRVLDVPTTNRLVEAMAGTKRFGCLNTWVLQIERAMMSYDANFAMEAIAEPLLQAKLPRLAHLVAVGALEDSIRRRLASRYWVVDPWSPEF
ncbi:MAG: hypothetical protein AAGE52_19610 [Myxococcota bacterium]